MSDDARTLGLALAAILTREWLQWTVIDGYEEGLFRLWVEERGGKKKFRVTIEEASPKEQEGMGEWMRTHRNPFEGGDS